MNGLSLYCRYVALAVRAQLSYPASFALQTVAQFANTLVWLLGVWALFQRFGQVQGWRFEEAALFYGAINISFAAAEMATHGFETFGAEFIRTGDFDRLLVRPRASALQVLGHELRLQALGRLLQGAAVLWFAALQLDAPWGWGSVALAAWAVAGGAALFAGVSILQAALCFWTVETLELATIFSHGAMEAGQYPLDIYAGWFRKLLTFVLPVACVGYFPLSLALGRRSAEGAAAWAAALSPVAGFLFLGVALLAWRLGVRRYTSAGG